MKQQACGYCHKIHNLYYLLMANGATSMFMLCPTLKAEDKIYIRFLPKKENLPIPTYASGTPEYDALKNSVEATSDEFSEEDMKIIKAWQTGNSRKKYLWINHIKLIKKWCVKHGCFGS